ncbi:MAG: hypothetical protein A2176_12395 [Spirochaetes bacterium RBG_13_51_14]|nr:MAG: hypothetical protein A2176_12395 [Spirochaetes bacterium RBG_13_51_14]
MNYRKELNKMREHHSRYYPVLKKLIAQHREWRNGDAPLQISETATMLIILELIDIGYADAESFIVRKRFDDVTGLWYTGRYPLTDDGVLFFRGNRLLSCALLAFFRKLFRPL